MSEVLLEFWSIDCPHADTIRPLVNRIAERFSSQNFAVLSIARESNASAVRDYLKTNPKSSIVMLRDDEAWKTFNPDGATPFCFLIDRDGVIQSRFLGATAVKTMENSVAGAIARRVCEPAQSVRGNDHPPRRPSTPSRYSVRQVGPGSEWVPAARRDSFRHYRIYDPCFSCATLSLSGEMPLIVEVKAPGGRVIHRRRGKRKGTSRFSLLHEQPGQIPAGKSECPRFLL